MVKIIKKYYDRSIKYTEIIILFLFALSAILMSMSQDKIMKSTEITLKNLENFEVTILAQQNTIESLLYYLISCNLLDLTKYVKESHTPEFLNMVEQAKEECVSNSLERVENASKNSLDMVNSSVQYKIITNNDFEKYRSESQNLSKIAFWIFISGVFLCFVLVLDLIIFEPEE